MIDWHEIDNSLLDPAYYTRTDYRDAFRQMRDEDPVRWVCDERYGKDYWALTRYDDVAEYLLSPRDFSSRWESRVPRTPKRMTPELRHELAYDVNFTTLDEPLHDLYRRPLNKHFSVPTVAKMRSDIGQIVDRIIADVAERGECELVEDIAAELPVQVVLTMLGVPQEDWPYLREASWQFLAAADPRWIINGDQVETSRLGLRKLLDYCTKLAMERRTNPKDDLATVIADLEVDSDKLSIHEMRGWFANIIAGGLETTRNAAAVGIWKLMSLPEQRELLVTDASLHRSAVEEVLRWVTPAKNRLRVATRDLEFRGRRIKRGDWVVGYLASANWDDRQFADPEAFDIRRTPNKHLALGLGPHLCLGRALARMELELLIPRIFAALPDLRPAIDGEPAWIADTSVTGFTTLPVAFTPSGPRARHRQIA